MCVLTVNLFGGLEVHRDEEALDGWNAGKAQELFAYLLLNRGHPHARQVLAGVLWPERTNEKSMKFLRHALWQLQMVLDCDVLQVETERLYLNPDADLWLDVREFERACVHLHGIPAEQLDGQRAHILREALKLYRGDLLEGWYQDWCLFERERLQGMFLAAVQKQMAYCEIQGQYELGLECGARALRCDIAHERIHRRLMRLHYLAGDRTAALRQYQRCEALLREELGVEPSERTVALFREICSGRQLTAAVGNGSVSGESPCTPDQALDLLKQVQMTFTKLEHQLQKAVQEVETALIGRD